jgi:hypothetical protein
MSPDPERIVPLDKFDDAAIANLRRADKAAILAQARGLLRWLQDGNWPPALPIAQVLDRYTNDIQEELREILRGDDGEWKYWCIIWLIRYLDAPALAPALLRELRRIADLPSRGPNEHEPIEEARDAWAQWVAKGTAGYAARLPRASPARSLHGRPPGRSLRKRGPGRALPYSDISSACL